MEQIGRFRITQTRKMSQEFKIKLEDLQKVTDKLSNLPIKYIKEVEDIVQTLNGSITPISEKDELPVEQQSQEEKTQTDTVSQAEQVLF